MRRDILQNISLFILRDRNPFLYSFLSIVKKIKKRKVRMERDGQKVGDFVADERGNGVASFLPSEKTRSASTIATFATKREFSYFMKFHDTSDDTSKDKTFRDNFVDYVYGFWDKERAQGKIGILGECRNSNLQICKLYSHSCRRRV